MALRDQLRRPISESMFARKSDMLMTLFQERREAADEIDNLLDALSTLVEWRGKRSYESPEAPDTLLPIDEQEPEIADAMRIIAKVEGQ